MLLPLERENSMFLWLPFMWSGGGELVNAVSRKRGEVNQGAITALQFWRNLIEDVQLFCRCQSGALR